MLRKYTFVTVSHQIDYDALCIQARSMTLYLPNHLVAEIIVIDNGITGSHDHLLAQYGQHRGHVRIIAARDIAPEITFTLKRDGWWSQQILKLMVCSHVKTARYVVLDAKNVLVYPLKRSFLETAWGKPRTRWVDFTNHTSRRWLVNTLRYFNLGDHHIKKFVPTTTPFTLITKVVCDLIKYVEKREKEPFVKVVYNHNLTEFFLYAAYLLHTNQSPYYFSQPDCHIIFDTTSSLKLVKPWVADTIARQLPFFAVHRRNSMGPEAQQLVKDLLKDRGL